MAKPLREAGFEVFSVRHQSIGIKKDPGGALQADAAALGRLMQQFTGRGKDVILVMHSYGGISGSEAVAMAKEDKHTRVGAGQIRRLVYLAAHVMNKGTSMLGSREVPGINIDEVRFVSIIA